VSARRAGRVEERFLALCGWMRREEQADEEEETEEGIRCLRKDMVMVNGSSKGRELLEEMLPLIWGVVVGVVVERKREGKALRRDRQDRLLSIGRLDAKASFRLTRLPLRYCSCFESAVAGFLR
jgi:hypothetical protein